MYQFDNVARQPCMQEKVPYDYALLLALLQVMLEVHYLIHHTGLCVIPTTLFVITISTPFRSYLMDAFYYYRTTAIDITHTKESLE